MSIYWHVAAERCYGFKQSPSARKSSQHIDDEDGYDFNSFELTKAYYTTKVFIARNEPRTADERRPCSGLSQEDYIPMLSSSIYYLETSNPWLRQELKDFDHRIRVNFAYDHSLMIDPNRSTVVVSFTVFKLPFKHIYGHHNLVSYPRTESVHARRMDYCRRLWQVINDKSSRTHDAYSSLCRNHTIPRLLLAGIICDQCGD